jgi:hypothetical protein
VSPAFKNILETVLRVKDIPGTIVLTLPLGWSIGEFFNMIVLWLAFQKDFAGFSKNVLKTFFQVLSAALVMGFVSYNFLNIFDNVFDLTTTFGIFMQGFLSGIMGIAVGVALLYFFNSQELGEIWQTLHKKIWRAKVIVPDAEMQ